MNELILYSSFDDNWLEWNNDLNNGGSGRSLLSSTCNNPVCDNDCYRGCGPDCSCWSWVCGGCGCYLGCEQHDYYCSCTWWGYAHYCCINVFSMYCDGSGSCWIAWF